jgi:hypothetical protein
MCAGAVRPFALQFIRRLGRRVGRRWQPFAGSCRLPARRQETPMNHSRLLVTRHLLAALAIVFATGASRAAGLDIHADADATDVGLPAYPGAVKQPDHDGDGSGFQFGAWGQSFGIKLAMVSYRSDDDVDKVAAFYRAAMARYGTVVDCSRNVKQPDAGRKADKDGPVACDSDTASPGGRLFKVGSNRSQRVFNAKPAPDGTRFELVQIDAHGVD